MLRCTVNRDLVCELVTAAGAHERQIGGVAVTVTVFVDAAKRLLPVGIRIGARFQAENAAGGGVDVQYVSGLVHDDNAIVDALQYRQHGRIRSGQAPLQTAALDRVIENRVLLIDRDIIDADVRGGARV